MTLYSGFNEPVRAVKGEKHFIVVLHIRLEGFEVHMVIMDIRKLQR